MALTVTSHQTARPPGAEERRIVKVKFDNSYAEGGESFTPSDVGLRRFDVDPVCNIIHGSESSELRAAAVYYASEKLHIHDAATGKEMAKEKDMSKVEALVTCYGH